MSKVTDAFGRPSVLIETPAACLQALDSNVNHKQVLKQVKHNMI